jgi:hypothetical protein
MQNAAQLGSPMSVSGTAVALVGRAYQLELFFRLQLRNNWPALVIHC